MATRIALVGDPQVQRKDWRVGLEQRWKDQNAGWLQRKLDLKWHSKFEQSSEEFDRVLEDITSKDRTEGIAETWLLGDLINPESFMGLTDDANFMASHELADWVRMHYPEVWKKRRVLTGNHDIGFRHPCATADKCRVTPAAFERFENVWGPYLHVSNHEGWTLIGLSSDLLLLDGVGGNGDGRELRAMRDAHVGEVVKAINEAERVVLLFHSPEAFRVLGVHLLNRDENCSLAKIKACFVGHLEVPGALKHYRRYQLAEGLSTTPLIYLTRMLFSPPDAVEAVRTHVSNCAKASRLLHPKTVLVPAARHGWVELVLDHDIATVLHYSTDGTALAIDEIRPS